MSMSCVKDKHRMFGEPLIIESANALFSCQSVQDTLNYSTDSGLLVDTDLSADTDRIMGIKIICIHGYPQF